MTTRPTPPLSSPLLLGAGPSNPYPEAMAALGRPMLGNLDPDLLALTDELCDQLRVVFGTTNPLTTVVGGAGSGGMEAAFANVLDPGDVIVIGVNGAFGERMCEVARGCRAEIVRVEAPWGEPIEPARMLAAHRSPKVIALAHAETSSGVRNDLAGLGEGKGDALLVVDCVTSLGGIPVEVDAWGIDIAFAASQKCLGAPPGLAPVTVSERAVARFVEHPVSWLFDLRMLAQHPRPVLAGGLFRQTAPVSLLFSLHAALGVILAEGLDESLRRHARAGSALHEGLHKLGLTTLAPPEHQLPQLTAVVVPDGVDAQAVRTRLRTDYGIELSQGLGPTADSLWRIGLMGHGARPGNVAFLLAALGEVLQA